MTMDEREDVITRFLRKISPRRDWLYICEVEHSWMNELYDELTAEFKDENTKLREENERLKLQLAQSDEACESYRDECSTLRTVCGSYMRKAYASAIEEDNPIAIEIVESQALALGIEVSE